VTDTRFCGSRRRGRHAAVRLTKHVQATHRVPCRANGKCVRATGGKDTRARRRARLVAARPTVMPPPPGHGRRHLRSIPILPHVPTSPSTRWFGSRGKPRLFIAVLRCSYRSLAQTNRPKPSGGGWGRSYTCTRDLAGSGPHLSVGDGDETVTWQRTKEKQRT
jgi:hypothetical protein